MVYTLYVCKVTRIPSWLCKDYRTPRIDIFCVFWIRNQKQIYQENRWSEEEASDIIFYLSWEFIKENKKAKIRKENTLSTMKTNQKKERFFFFFLVAFLVESVFSCFLTFFFYFINSTSDYLKQAIATPFGKWSQFSVNQKIAKENVYKYVYYAFVF